MRMSIGDTASLFGISVRALRYYDEIGLVAPAEVSDSGYRFYGDDSIEVLEQVMFFRELEFSLEEIKAILNNPHYDKMRALSERRELLTLKRKHIDDLITILDHTIGGKEMKGKHITTAADIDEARKRYAEEVRERWGNTASYAECERKYGSYTPKDKEQMAGEAEDIFRGFAGSIDKSPDDEAVQELVRKWQEHITKYHYMCTDEILACLGEMYVSDERFAENIDRYGPGTAKFISDAIREYCSK